MPRPISRLPAMAFAVALALCGTVSLASAQEAPEESVAPGTATVGVHAHPAPPANFDPLTASDADLKHFGFPPRPDAQAAPQQFAIWQKLVTAPQTRIVPTLQETTIRNAPAKLQSAPARFQVDSKNQPPAGANAPTLVGSTNWSGFAVSDTNNPFKAGTTVFAEYVVPIAQQPAGQCDGGWDYSAEWVGIDGFNSSDVLQAGVEADARCANGAKKAFYKTWIEWFPNVAFRIKNLTIHPGNIIGVAVWNSSPTQGNALLVDYSTQKSVSVTFGAPSGTTLTGDSVEWVIERPDVNGTPAALMHYVADPFNFCGATGGTLSYGPGLNPTGTAYSIGMLDGPGPNAKLLSFADVYATSTLWFYEPGPAAQ